MKPGVLAMRILDLLEEGPATTKEITEEVGGTPNSVRARMSELRKLGAVRRLGSRGKYGGRGYSALWEVLVAKE